MESRGSDKLPFVTRRVFGDSSLPSVFLLFSYFPSLFLFFFLRDDFLHTMVLTSGYSRHFISLLLSPASRSILL